MSQTKYILNIDAIMDYVFNTPDMNSQTDIVEMYGLNESGLIELQNKQISESKNVQNDSSITIKYDFIKNILGLVSNVESEDALTLSEEMALNGLLTKGFIKKIN